MDTLTFTVPCLFGLEGLAANELRRLGLEGVQAENGRVRFTGGWDAMATANVCLRTGERVLLLLGRFPADSFEALFQGVLACPLEQFIPRNGVFPVKGHCLDSQLHSVPDCQAIVKKAAARRLGQAYQLGWLPEDGATYQLQFSIMKDVCELYLDTSGVPLYKRGYRADAGAAPLRETLAAAIVQLSHYRGRELFLDPFCGSGTLCIEAAWIARNRAPGLTRRFAAERWDCVGEAPFRAAREAAKAREFHGNYTILGSDIDPEAVALARANAQKAGVEHLVRFERADALRRDYPAQGILCANPPYGERMLEQQQARALMRQFGRRMAGLKDGWRMYLISSDEQFESAFGRRADKKRKLYNGMLKCNLHMYGERGRT